MCGFVGVYSVDESRPAITPEQLRRMRETLRHRGPDDEGLWIAENDRLGLGFRRLSIIDLSPSGNQPMALPDGSLCVVFNGEIYNYRELRTELEREGVAFCSQTDTEV